MVVYRKILLIICIVFVSLSCGLKNENCTSNILLNNALTYCDQQIRRTLFEIDNTSKMPRNILKNQTKWNLVKIDITDWTVGFWPGILWYDYENTKNEDIKKQAIRFTELLDPLTKEPPYDHDLGFQIFCSYGNAYRLTGNEKYKQIVLNAADTLATFFNSKVGTILSWKRNVPLYGGHNTIIDNMLNLEILFWAAKNGGEKKLYDIAVKHADTTMKYGFRPDGGCYHVVVYDTISGNFIKGVTHQGYADSSLWARGQAWAIYGYTMVYRETGNKKFLRFAEKTSNLYLSRLPENQYIPYWDFDAPSISNVPPYDVSAATIAASGLLELSKLEDNSGKAEVYKTAAIKMLEELSSDKFQSRKKNPAFLQHSVGHFPAGSEIDASIIYADYYYIEALTRLKYFRKK